MHHAALFDNASIADTVEMLREKFATLGVSSRDIVRHALVTEEVLLCWQDAFGTTAQFDVRTRKRFSKVTVELRCAGRPCNPLPQPDAQEQMLDALGHTLLQKLGAQTHYAYEGGVNRVTITLTKARKNNPTLELLAYVGIALVLGLALRFCPPPVADFVMKDVVNPLVTVFSGFLSAAMIFVIFFSIAASIVNLGSVEELYSFAGKVLKKFIGTSLCCAALTTLILFLCLPVQIAEGQQSQTVFGPLRDLVLQIIPTNFATAFTDKNIPQVIFLSMLLSTIILMFNETLEPLKKLLLSCNELFLRLLTLLIRTIPLFMGLCILQGMSQDFTRAVGLGLVATVTCIAVQMFFGIFIWVRAMKKSGYPLGSILRQSMPAFTVAFCTLSSSSAFPLQMKLCKDVLKLPPRVYNFGLPMSLVFNKTIDSSALVFVVMTCLCLANISVPWEALVLLPLQAVILGAASPPVAGGPLLIITMLITQFSIPLDTFGLAAVLMMLTEPPGAAVVVMVTQGMLVDVARETENPAPALAQHTPPAQQEDVQKKTGPE